MITNVRINELIIKHKEYGVKAHRSGDKATFEFISDVIESLEELKEYKEYKEYELEAVNDLMYAKKIKILLTEIKQKYDKTENELRHYKECALRPATKVQSKVIDSILTERQRQDKKWGEQNHLPQFWTGILGEEFGELCQAVNETVFDNGPEERKKGGYENMRREAIHVAAVAVGFLECLERNRGHWGYHE